MTTMRTGCLLQLYKIEFIIYQNQSENHQSLFVRNRPTTSGTKTNVLRLMKVQHFFV